MVFPNSDYPTSLDAAETRVDGADVVYANDFNYHDEQVRLLQQFLGLTGELLGSRVTSGGIGGAVSPAADGGVAFTLAAREDFTSGKLLSLGDNYDVAYVEKFSIDADGNATAAGSPVVTEATIPPFDLATAYAALATGFVSTRGASPQEDKAGEVAFDGSDFSFVAFRILLTTEFATTGSVDVRLYDYGPAAGPPTLPRLVSTLTTTVEGGPQLLSQTLTVVSAGPGANEILDSLRLYRATVEVDGSSGDSVYVGGAWIFSQGGGTAPTVTDPDAIHAGTSGEIALVSEKVAPVSADVLLIEDSENSNVKKKLQLGNLPGGTDTNAVHLNEANEFGTVSQKFIAAATDRFLIEDMAAAGAKKYVEMSGISATDDDAVHYSTPGEFALKAIGEKLTPVVADLLLIEDSVDEFKRYIQVGNLPTGSSTDPNAVHVNTAGEIAAVGQKLSPTGSDLLLIEDAADSNNKKRIQIGNFPSMTDANAIHRTGSTEISTLTEKVTPVSADVLVIEDSAASYAKRKLQVGNLPGGADPNAVHVNVSGEIAGVTLKGTPTTSDLLLIEDAAATNAKKRITIGSLPAGAAVAPRTAKLIVGNSPAGDTAANCTHLDTGNGAQLKAAIAAATAGTDVYIRPGTYDFNLLAGNLPIGIPNGVRVWGAGRGHVLIKTEQTSGTPVLRAFVLNTASELYDVSIYVPIPANSSWDNDVVLLNGIGAECHRVTVSFATGYNATSMARLSLTGVFYPQSTQTKIIDCRALDIPAKKEFLSVPDFNYLCGVRTAFMMGLTKAVAIERFEATKGDVGIALNGAATVSNCIVTGSWERCLWAGNFSHGTSLSHNFCQMDRDGEAMIYLEQCEAVDADGNFFLPTFGGSVLVGVKMVSATRCTVRGNRCQISLLPISATLNASSNYNIVLGNNLPFTVSGITDSGTGNVVQHNL